MGETAARGQKPMLRLILQIRSSTGGKTQKSWFPVLLKISPFSIMEKTDPQLCVLSLQRCRGRWLTSRWCTGSSSGWRMAPCTSMSPWAVPSSSPGPPLPASRSLQRSWRSSCTFFISQSWWVEAANGIWWDWGLSGRGWWPDHGGRVMIRNRALKFSLKMPVSLLGWTSREGGMCLNGPGKKVSWSFKKMK